MVTELISGFTDPIWDLSPTSSSCETIRLRSGSGLIPTGEVSLNTLLDTTSDITA